MIAQAYHRGIKEQKEYACPGIKAKQASIRRKHWRKYGEPVANKCAKSILAGKVAYASVMAIVAFTNQNILLSVEIKLCQNIDW